MKPFFLLALVCASLFLTGCDTLVVEHRTVVRDGYYGGYNGGYDRGYYHERSYARPAVVVVNRPAYRPAPYYGGVRIVYSTDKHGKYYWRNGKRVYVARW